MLNEDSLQYMKENFYNIHEEEVISDDYFVQNKICALGAKKPFFQYDNDEDIIDDTVSLKVPVGKVDEKQVYNALLVATSGVGKTVKVKRKMYSFYRLKYKILIIEPKMNEYLKSKNPGKDFNLHPYDKIQGLPIVGIAPYFIKDKIPIEHQKDYTYYTNDVRKFNTMEDWINLGASKGAAMAIAAQIEKGNYKLTNIISKIRDFDEMATGSVNAAVTNVSNLISLKFFSKSHEEDFDLKKLWDEDKIVVVNYWAQSGKLVNTDCAKLLCQVRDIGMREHEKTNKLIIFDDNYIILNSDSISTGVNSALNEMVNSMNNWRSYGVNNLIITQQLGGNFIDRALVESCNHFFISVTRNPRGFVGRISPRAVNILQGKYERPLRQVKTMVDGKPRVLYEWIHCWGVESYQRYFPFMNPQE